MFAHVSDLHAATPQHVERQPVRYGEGEAPYIPNILMLRVAKQLLERVLRHLARLLGVAELVHQQTMQLRRRVVVKLNDFGQLSLPRRLSGHH